VNLRENLDAKDPFRENTSDGEPPFSHLENLQTQAALTAEQLSNLIGMECSSEWADAVRRLADALHSQLKDMLEILSDLTPQRP
jgi:hypothetical protein